MAIAPLRGRPAPLLFSRQERTKWPRYSPSELKNAPLSTRARRVRRRRAARIAALVAVFAAMVAAVSWFIWWR